MTFAVDSRQVEELEEVVNGKMDSSRITFIGSKLELGDKQELIAFLKSREEDFAWSLVDMIGINPLVITHKLQIDPTVKLV